MPFGERFNSKKSTCCGKPETRRCIGSINCTACTTCNFCKYCIEGRTCGVCSVAKQNSTKSKKTNSSYPKPLKDMYSSKCQALTKKGTRCSRISRSNGFCWQHGG